jgi:hypothetical protein
MGWLSPTTPSPMSAELDIMGFSHASEGTVASFHSAKPNQVCVLDSLHTLAHAHTTQAPTLAVPMQPLVMSECCSCETQRGEDADLKVRGGARPFFVLDRLQVRPCGESWLGSCACFLRLTRLIRVTRSLSGRPTCTSLTKTPAAFAGRRRPPTPSRTTLAPLCGPCTSEGKS